MSELDANIGVNPISRLVNREFFNDLYPSKSIQAETYLARLNGFDQEAASAVAKEFEVVGKLLAKTLVLIPVAAHQESDNISRTMKLYADQVSDEPFSVLLYLNAPYGADEGAIQATEDAVSAAQREYPELDLRASSVDQESSSTIGGIRRTLWNAATLLSYVEGGFEQGQDDPIGINHDIDATFMSPRYIARVQKHIKRRTTIRNGIGDTYDKFPLPPAYTVLRHSYDSSCPNASDVVAWNDISYKQMKLGGSYEASLVIPLGMYMSSGGFRSNDGTHETSKILRGIRPFKIPGTIFSTSPRRFIDRLHDNDLSEVWTKDSFSSTDPCRQLGEREDISADRKDELIFNSLEERLQYFFAEPYKQITTNSYYSDSPDAHIVAADQLTRMARQKKNLSVQVLRRFIKSPINANIVENDYDPLELISKWLSEVGK